MSKTAILLFSDKKFICSSPHSHESQISSNIQRRVFLDYLAFYNLREILVIKQIETVFFFQFRK